MRYFLIAGEASGDLHGANLMKGIQKADAKAEFKCYGGEKMKAAGGILLKHYQDLALMGIWEVFKNIRRFIGYIDTCKKEIKNFSPDVLILIDYAGFNLRIARFGKHEQIPVYYYISPKLWAWGKSRFRRIKKFVTKMIVILPFEVGFYKKLGIKADFYGNPVIDEIDKFNRSYSETADKFRTRQALNEKPIIALLAGSRKQEIDLCLPEMLAVTPDFPDCQFVVACARSVEKEYYKKFLKNQNVKMIYDETYPLLKSSVAAIVTSGTATLETALFNVPQVVIYKTSAATYYLGQLFVFLGFIHLKFFSLVNIILDRELLNELLQFRLSSGIRKELKAILCRKARNDEILRGYEEIRTILMRPGVSDRVASSIVRSLNENFNKSQD